MLPRLPIFLIQDSFVFIETDARLKESKCVECLDSWIKIYEMHTANFGLLDPEYGLRDNK